MTTVINTPPPSTGSGSSGLILSAVIIGFIIIASYFGIPAIRRMNQTETNIIAPQIVVPEKININVEQQEQ